MPVWVSQAQLPLDKQASLAGFNNFLVTVVKGSVSYSIVHMLNAHHEHRLVTL